MLWISCPGRNSWPYCELHGHQGVAWETRLTSSSYNERTLSNASIDPDMFVDGVEAAIEDDAEVEDDTIEVETKAHADVYSEDITETAAKNDARVQFHKMWWPL